MILGTTDLGKPTWLSSMTIVEPWILPELYVCIHIASPAPVSQEVNAENTTPSTVQDSSGGTVTCHMCGILRSRGQDYHLRYHIMPPELHVSAGGPCNAQIQLQSVGTRMQRDT